MKPVITGAPGPGARAPGSTPATPALETPPVIPPTRQNEHPVSRGPAAGRGHSGDAGVELRYPRHFLCLFCFAAILAAAGPWGRPQPLALAFGVYGALHAVAVVMSERKALALSSILLFVGFSAVASMLSVVAMLFAAKQVAASWGPSPPGLWLTLGAGLGAAVYSALLRGFGVHSLAPRAMLLVALGCMVAMPLAFLLGSALGVLSGLWFAVCWWFAASVGLWCQDPRTPLGTVGTRRSDAGNS